MRLRSAALATVALVLVLGTAGALVVTSSGSDTPEPRVAVRPEAPRPAPEGARPGPPSLPRERGRASSFALERVATGLVQPTWAGAAPGDDDGLWVLEQPGRVIRLAGGRRRVVLDLRPRVRLGAEQGLLGAAFHPDFANDRRLFLHFSDRSGDTRVVEVRIGRDGRADPARGRELLFVDQPEENHNGGALVFGPDGRLHLGLGDGGGAFDPGNRAQELRSKLGKLLAADVDRRRARPRWTPVAYGLRNPWRFSFDPALGEVWIGDVGQDSFEEVHRVALEPDEPPKNLGWDAFEGTKRQEGAGRRGPGALTWPVAGYGRRDGCSITGGLVYRGGALPALAGRYLYGDFCTGALWSLRPGTGGGAEDVRRERAVLPQVTHIGADGSGELLLAGLNGSVWRARPPR